MRLSNQIAAHMKLIILINSFNSLEDRRLPRHKVSLDSRWVDNCLVKTPSGTSGLIHNVLLLTGPKDWTIEAMWMMIWQEKTNTIVMLANLYELGKVRLRRETFMLEYYQRYMCWLSLIFDQHEMYKIYIPTVL